METGKQYFDSFLPRQISNTLIFFYSAYGKCITSLKKHKDTRFTDGQEMFDLHNDPYHHKTETVSDDCFEVSLRKKKINFNLPMIIGLSVYNYAKLRVLEFIYDVLLKCVSKTDFMFLESDTDSIYLALSADSLEDIIIPEKRALFEALRPKWFVLDDSQKRTPGLLKIEKTAEKFIGLCSKCYICDDDHAKTKGMQDRNKEIMKFLNFYKVLFDLPGAERIAFNVGIRFLKNSIHTYVQSKQGLTSLYVKRLCMPNGSTAPLNL